jgi:hypothetical protein
MKKLFFGLSLLITLPLFASPYETCDQMEEVCHKIKIERISDLILSEAQADIKRAERNLKKVKCLREAAECRVEIAEQNLYLRAN